MSAVKARTGDASAAAAAARAGSAAVEEGAMPMPSVKRPPRRRQVAYRLPASVALAAVGVFLFFVVLGHRDGAAGGGGKSSGTTTTGSGGGGGKAERSPPFYRVGGLGGLPTLFKVQVMAELPHDAGAFTQGLQYDVVCDDEEGAACREVFWESTGLRGRSSVREVDLASGKVARRAELPRADFGEGLTRLGDRLFQLTWQSGKLWSYAVDDLTDAVALEGPLADGWGVTTNGTHLIVGDSSATLYFLEPETLRVVREIEVKDGGAPVRWLNELEWVDGLIYANVYQTDCLAQVDPNNGGVVGWVQARGLRGAAEATAAADAAVVGGAGAAPTERPDVLNGVAWDAEGGRLFLTGKLWPRVYQVELRPLYRDSKRVSVPKLLAEVRAACIPAAGRAVGR